jgi:hypothetical protein
VTRSFTFTVGCPGAEAFDIWTREIPRWTRTSLTADRGPRAELIVEPRARGRIFERGQARPLGTISAWERPERFAYRITAPDAVVDVEVQFEDVGNGTTVVSIQRCEK